jgi:hypothetical protein
MPRFVISGRPFELDQERVEYCVTGLLPDPLQQHYVIVSGRRFPPKQVLACATGLDRADFTTHQARRILCRLGFVAARLGQEEEQQPVPSQAQGPHDGQQAALLAAHVGQWVALAGPLEILVAADTPQEVLSWLSRHGRRADYGMFRVPESEREAQGAAPE